MLARLAGQVTALQLTISKYKHSATGRPFVIYIHKEQPCCPVKAILDFIYISFSALCKQSSTADQKID